MVMGALDDVLLLATQCNCYTAGVHCLLVYLCVQWFGTIACLCVQV